TFSDLKETESYLEEFQNLPKSQQEKSLSDQLIRSFELWQVNVNEYMNLVSEFEEKNSDESYLALIRYFNKELLGSRNKFNEQLNNLVSINNNQISKDKSIALA
ncbi:MAG: hypothetical protein ABR512_15880, partial [Desulfopila sp.]